MIKKLLLTILLPWSLYSYELNFSKTFAIAVNPDILKMRISVNLQSKDERFITDNLETINDFIKEDQDIKYSNGSFNLTPRYLYKNKRIKFIGNISYIIITNNANSMNEFINELINTKNKLDINNLKLNIGHTSWEISDKLNRQSQDNLRLEAINWIVDYANNLNKSCKVIKINIGSNGNKYIPLTYRSDMVAPDISPAKNIKSISIDPNFTLECR